MPEQLGQLIPEKKEMLSASEQISPALNILYFQEKNPYIGTKTLNLAMKQVLGLFDVGKQQIVEGPAELMEKLKTGDLDIVIFNHANQELLKIITKIRNSQQIKKQPAIFVQDFNRSILKEAIAVGADIAFDIPNVTSLLAGIHSVPELLAKIEDDYGDKALINKEHFYKVHKNKLAARSEITADLPKELNILEEIFQKNEVRKILDAGGGEGRIAIPLAQKGYEVTNVDSSPELIKQMNQKSKAVAGVVGDIRHMPLADNNYDAVMYNWHVFCDILGNKGKQKVLSEAKRVLKKGGTLVLDIPNRDIYESVDKMVAENNPAFYNNKEEMMQKLLEFNRDFEQEKDPIAKSIILQGRNMLAYMLDEPMYFEPDFEELKGQDQYDFEIEKVEYRKDGVYLGYGDQSSVFIGYVPSEQEMKKHLEKAGFKDIKAKKWKTKKGFYKITFDAHK